ncbi:bifunctional ADP-dependent NAD(P)H-hydrate dehydratase/NAD(P)H-hydrate epimerase, partial [Pseudonocardia sp. KRD291]|uniref:bifunctional ADP-dependent NAD(P)H-hydrate dehydratase/NAD(P)H-hydrate epimerase n=1 Tax=Pseudonocardia sp. KRD291 TaxID=2792007 RepID=UPI001C49D53D
MHGVYSADQVRAAEGAMLGGVGDGVLMRRAAAGLAAEVRGFLGSTYGRRVVLLVGAGDNGGDALWAGVGLRRRGAHVTALLLSPDRAHPAGLAALRSARGRVLPVDPDGLEPARAAVRGADVVIDGIVGISGRPGLREPAPALVSAADDAGVPIVACDLPSGVDADTGRTDGAHVRAAMTVTFGCRKPVHALAAPSCGPVRLVDFGLGPFLAEHAPEPHAHLLSDADVGARWPVPGPADDKYTQGVVGIAAGSATFPGAAVLAAGAAALSTSGMVRFAGSAADEVRRHWPEIVATDGISDAGRTQAWAIGPGIGTGDAGRELLEAVLDRDVPLCVDADAITLLAQHRHLRDRIHGRPIVLTPHAGEFARIAGDVGTDRVGAARRAAADLGVTVLLKGNATVVADPDGRTLIDPAADAWAATAGSGDVLTGMIGALLAAGLAPWWAAGC